MLATSMQQRAWACSTRCIRQLSRGYAMQATRPARPWNSHRLTGSRPATPSAQTPSADNATSHLSPSPATANKMPSQQTSTSPTTSSTSEPKRRRPLRPLKAAISLTPKAVEHLHQLLSQPEPKLIRVGVRNRGCSGLTYHLEYVEKPGKFDEEVTQDGVKVLIDSKALFSVIGSEMDWVDDKLSSRFVFNNPNSKGSCGCGESFMV